MNIKQTLKSFGRNIAKKFKELTTAQTNKKIKELMKERKKLRNKDLVPGNLIFTTYNAKDKEQTYDKTPLALILRRNNSHTLVLNFHWIPMSMRLNLIKIIIASNVKNIQNNKPLEFSYKNLRPLLKSLGYAPVIRLYINSRMGKVGVVIPPERLIEAARLKTESFTNGRYSASELYARARKRGKSKK